jgi:hypothetical protein
MDLKLQRPGTVCQATEAVFAPGDTIYSAVVRDGGGLVRLDWSATAWSGPPKNTLAWWRSIVPEPEEKGIQLAPVDILLDTLEALGTEPDEAPLRYLLALQLVRRRVLRFAEPAVAATAEQANRSGADRQAAETVAFSCRRRDCDYTVVVAVPAPADRQAVEERLAGLLWSGGEA